MSNVSSVLMSDDSPKSDYPTVRIRPATLQDATSLASLSSQLNRITTPETMTDRIRTLLTFDDHAVLVAETATSASIVTTGSNCGGGGGGDVIGFVHVHVQRTVCYDKRVEVLTLVVDEKFRSLGTGRKLVAASEAWALQQPEVEQIFLYSRSHRNRAHSFYEKMGYREHHSSKFFEKVLKP